MVPVEPFGGGVRRLPGLPRDCPPRAAVAPHTHGPSTIWCGARHGRAPGRGGEALSHRRHGRRRSGLGAGLARRDHPPLTAVMPDATPQLPRVMNLRDVVLFNLTAIVGLRWLTTAASQFGLASLLMWLAPTVVFFIPSALPVPPPP